MHRREKAKKKRAIKISNLCLEKEVIEKNVIVARGAILMSHAKSTRSFHREIS